MMSKLARVYENDEDSTEVELLGFVAVGNKIYGICRYPDNSLKHVSISVIQIV